MYFIKYNPSKVSLKIIACFIGELMSKQLLRWLTVVLPVSFMVVMLISFLGELEVPQLILVLVFVIGGTSFLTQRIVDGTETDPVHSERGETALFDITWLPRISSRMIPPSFWLAVFGSSSVVSKRPGCLAGSGFAQNTYQGPESFFQ